MITNSLTLNKSPVAEKKRGKVGSFFRNISPFNTQTDMPKPLFIIKKLLGYLIANMGSMIIGTALIVLVHYPLGVDPLKGECFDGYIGQLFTMLNYCLPCLFILLYWHLFEKKKLSEMYVRKGICCYLLGGILGALLIFLCVGAITLTGAVKINGLAAHPDYLAIALSGGMYIFQSAMEELLCRGVAFSTVKDKLGIPAAFAVSTAFFTVPHLSSMQGAGAASAIGVLNNVLISAIFLLIMLLTDSIWAACGTHFVWNFFLNNIFGLTVSGTGSDSPALLSSVSVGKSLLNGSIFGIEASILTTVFYFVCAAALFVLYRRKSANERG